MAARTSFRLVQVPACRGNSGKARVYTLCILFVFIEMTYLDEISINRLDISFKLNNQQIRKFRPKDLIL